jgi:hypothetical protein
MIPCKDVSRVEKTKIFSDEPDNHRSRDHMEPCLAEQGIAILNGA